LYLLRLQQKKDTENKLKLQNFYLEKLNRKIEIFYYLKWIRQFKNLKKYIFKKDNEPEIFRILATHAYTIKDTDHHDIENLIKKKNNEKKLKKYDDIIDNWFKNFNYENDFSNYIFENYKKCYSENTDKQ